MHLRYKTAQGILHRLAEGLCADLNSLNIPKEHFDLVKSGTTWIAIQDRMIVVNVINSIIYGSLDLQGVDRFPIPVEYTATVIASIVHPTNRMTACSWMEQASYAASDLSQNANPESIAKEPITASQCYALVCELQSEDLEQVIVQFERRCNMKLEKQRKLTSAT